MNKVFTVSPEKNKKNEATYKDPQTLSNDNVKKLCKKH